MTQLIDHGATSEISEVRARMTREKINATIDSLVDVVSSEAFIDYVNDIGSLPTHHERLRFTEESANLETVRERGVNISRELRLTTRQFETPEDGRNSESPLVSIRQGEDPRMGFCGSVGVYVCGSYGG